MFVLKMYVQIMSLSVLLCNVCVSYVYILKMSKKIKVKKKMIRAPSNVSRVHQVEHYFRQLIKVTNLFTSV